MWWLEFSQRLFLATWPFAIATLTAFSVWTTKSITSQDKRISSLEQWGPSAGPRFGQSDAEQLRMRIMSDVDSKTGTKFTELLTRMESIQHTVIELKVRQQLERRDQNEQ